jgi:hypothetical protein
VPLRLIVAGTANRNTRNQRQQAEDPDDHSECPQSDPQPRPTTLRHGLHAVTGRFARCQRNSLVSASVQRFTRFSFTPRSLLPYCEREKIENVEPPDGTATKVTDA